ncbi:hypothetical protein AAAC51_37315 [Priestia megaterium]
MCHCCYVNGQRIFVSTQASAAPKTDDIGVEADAAILVEASTGKVLYGKIRMLY